MSQDQSPFKTFSRTTQLSRDFTLEEFFRSDIAEKVGGDMLAQQIAGMNNRLVVASLACLVKSVLQPARDFFNAPIIITSGYRGELLNGYLKSTKNSYHREGLAVDCILRIGKEPAILGNAPNGLLFLFFREKIEELGIDTLIHEYGTEMAPERVHVNFPREGREPRGRVGYIGDYTGGEIASRRPW